jgi:tetratricopeptide (TPR) repeat protein
MRLIVLLSVGWVLFAAPPAHAELRGVTLYERGDYARARKSLEEDLRSSKLSKEDRVKARLYLAAALHASGAAEAARIQLEELALTAPSLQVDPILFPPDFVALADKARKGVEAQRQEVERKRQEEERQQQEAERKRVEAERLAKEQAEAQNATPPEEPPTVEEEEEAPPVQLRPQVFSFLDPFGKRWGLGGAVSLGFGAVDVNARALAGTHPSFGAEVGVLLGSGTVQPRLALRASAIPGAHAFGGGAVAGLRVVPANRLILLADVGAELLKVDNKPENETQFRSFVLTGSVGVGFDLL